MDLCDEADTTNDGKISIEEYLTIAKNYGIKVFITDCFLFWFFLLFSAVQRWYWACRGSCKQQQRTLKEWLYFPHQGIDCSFHLDIPNLLQRKSFSSICDSVTHRHPRHLRHLLRVMRKHDLANKKTTTTRKTKNNFEDTIEHLKRAIIQKLWNFDISDFNWEPHNIATIVTRQ